MLKAVAGLAGKPAVGIVFVPYVLAMYNATKGIVGIIIYIFNLVDLIRHSNFIGTYKPVSVVVIVAYAYVLHQIESVVSIGARALGVAADTVACKSQAVKAVVGIFGAVAFAVNARGDIALAVVFGSLGYGNRFAVIARDGHGLV